MPSLTHGIRSVKIENYRCIDKLELDFTDPQGHPSDIVVIGGPNGSGKTAVLEACILALGGESEHPRSKGAKGDSAWNAKSDDIDHLFQRIGWQSPGA